MKIKIKSIFRLTEKVRPGSWTVLLNSMRQWIKNDDKDIFQ